MKDHKPTVLLGVTGCIAAYKACGLLRALQQHNVHAKVVMTKNAAEFIGPPTFRALTNEEVALELFDEAGDPIHHLSLAREADVFAIIPCTANVLNKIAHGVADDLLTTTALATTAPLVIAPAMNGDMWRATQTQDSITILRNKGVVIVEPEGGYLACGDEDDGRLAGMNLLIEAVLGELKRSTDLEGKRVLVTAGPTREPIDPVRFVSSPSSGLTGFLLAEEAARRGAEVTLIAGPVALGDPHGVTTIHVTTAEEMLAAATDAYAGVDAAVFAAAVADFRPATRANKKLKKGTDLKEDGFSLELVANPDILAQLAGDEGRAGNGKPVYVVGFAAETEDTEKHARAKLTAKNADLIIANDISQEGLGFASTHNQVIFVDHESTEATDVISKRNLARLICDRIAANLT